MIPNDLLSYNNFIFMTLEWPVCEKRKGNQVKKHDISHCFRLGRKGWQGKVGKDIKKRIVKKVWQGYAEAARGLGVLVEVGFSLIPVNQGVWGGKN